MSLNWLEINRVLEELPLEGSFLQNIRQSSYTHVILEFHRPGKSFNLLICLDRKYLRLHEISTRPASLSKPPRFTSFLRSRIKGARLVRAEQLGTDRIIKLNFRKGDREDILYIRLWGGASNLILCSRDDVILDAFSRRPARKEVPGEVYKPVAATEPPRKTFELREAPDDFTGYSAFLENLYANREEEDSLHSIREKVRSALEYRENSLKVSLGNQERVLGDYQNEQKYRDMADLLMSSLHLIKKGQKEYRPDTEGQAIPLDPSKTAAENAQAYYKKAGKASRGKDLREEEIRNIRNNLKRVEEELEHLEEITDPDKLRSMVPEDKIRKKETHTGTPGLSFSSADFTILVGRSAVENESLLSRHVRGNDYWLHTRDYPGAYVFIRLPRGKSVPLETLLDAGNLALFYSKARESGAADLYYTQVKYLRKPKDGKKGLVLPTREKNLFVKLDESRIKRLKGEE